MLILPRKVSYNRASIPNSFNKYNTVTGASGN